MIIFQLEKQKTYVEGQALTYRGKCPTCSGRAITVQTTFKGRNAVWPPHDGIPDRCDKCEAKAATA